MRNYPSIGIQVPDLFLPSKDVDLTKWSVIACDQFTSQPEYWEDVKKIVGASPSTLNLILPELFLDKLQENFLISQAQNKMKEYQRNRILIPHEGLVLVERITQSGTRHGLLMSVDLEKYDYGKSSKSLIRATEGTILERIPSRMRIREKAELEIPHILLLIDDDENIVIEPIVQQIPHLTKLYDFELMLGSGHLKGYQVENLELERGVKTSLEILAQPGHFHKKYKIPSNKEMLLFAVGDGNHSLASAKAVWELRKKDIGMDHPLRYALVEVENIHDHGLYFRPIHRVLFSIQKPLINALRDYFGDCIEIIEQETVSSVITNVDQQAGKSQSFGIINSESSTVVTIKNPISNLVVGSLQGFLDDFLAKGGAERIDYIHGKETLVKISQQPKNSGFYLPAMPKNELFRTVILNGVLPRKTFSMGEARDKRFYLECRKIQDL